MVILIQFVIYGLVLLAAIVGSIRCYVQEKKDFNDGICPHCGKPLIHFDDDSQGGQGWCCDDCKYFVWITWIKHKVYH